MSDASLEISRLIKAPVAKVFQAWVDPQQMCQWMGPGTVVCEKAVMDVRVGGQYELHMQTNEGMKVALGEYRLIEENKKLVFTWYWQDGDFRDSLVSLDFTEQDGATLLVLQHEHLPSTTSAEHHSEGWTGCIDKLQSYLGQV